MFGLIVKPTQVLEMYVIISNITKTNLLIIPSFVGDTFYLFTENSHPTNAVPKRIECVKSAAGCETIFLIEKSVNLGLHGLPQITLLLSSLENDDTEAAGVDKSDAFGSLVAASAFPRLSRFVSWAESLTDGKIAGFVCTCLFLQTKAFNEDFTKPNKKHALGRSDNEEEFFKVMCDPCHTCN